VILFDWCARAARKKNSSLRIQNLDEGLATVLKCDGTKGKLFPADLRSLLSYDAGSIRDLVKDYGLAEDEVQDVNVNHFLNHIGEAVAAAESKADIVPQEFCSSWLCR
jgi:hypothetical protein